MKTIHIKGARTHNLKNLDLVLPRNRLIVITGISGSGKSSLAFDTIYAEGQRRYVESLSAYARQFLERMEKPDVDHIEGLSPAISIEQKSTSHNPRSTVGTITEIYDYLRLLYARAGTPKCPIHHETLEAKTVGQIADEIVCLPEATRTMLLAPVVKKRKGEYVQLFHNLKTQGFLRARVNGEIVELDSPPKLDLRKKHTIEVVVDRLSIKKDIRLRLAESLETALKLAGGIVCVVLSDTGRELVFSSCFACPHCGYSLSELEPRLFSFNSPIGACEECDGLGHTHYFDEEKIVANPSLGLAAGAIRGWDQSSRYNFQRLRAVAKHNNFSLNTAFSSLSKKIRHLILYGCDESRIPFEYRENRGKATKYRHFPGIIPLMERRYEETESEAVRNELEKYITEKKCTACSGTRLNEKARNVFIMKRNLPEITGLPIEAALTFFRKLKLEGNKTQIAEKIVAEIRQRLSFLVNVGLEYLSLDRSAETLSGGEAQRIRLAGQIGSGLVGVMYILDEPSIGLHQRDNKRLLKTLEHLRDLGNSVIVVEHDHEAICSADHVVDLGPGAGKHGGHVVAQGTPKQIAKASASLTGKYLCRKKTIPVPEKRTPQNPKRMVNCYGLNSNNLKNINVEIPVGLFTCVTGVSGSGKSTLVNETLYAYASGRLNGSLPDVRCRRITGLEHFDKIIDINQSPIGRTPRSNPATYTGLFTPIRELFASVPESRSRGYMPGRFSFNVRGGRCEACQGDGLIKVEMHFLPDVHVICDRCRGKRYNHETLDIRYKGVNINDVLEMTVENALEFFRAVPVVRNKLATLMDVGLSYVMLGQNSTTLSGGEAQRVKLSRELSKKTTGKTLYILDEPTTGLHFEDVRQLLKVLCRLRDAGNTIVVIEHNLDVVKTADWVIDLGPEGGHKGGRVVVSGTPETVSKSKTSHTGRYLAQLLHRPE